MTTTVIFPPSSTESFSESWKVLRGSFDSAQDKKAPKKQVTFFAPTSQAWEKGRTKMGRLDVIRAQKLGKRKNDYFIFGGVVYPKHDAYLEAKEGNK